MSTAPMLYWLPSNTEWKVAIRALRSRSGNIWPDAVRLAKHRLDFLQTNALDRLVLSALGQCDDGGENVRIALLGSSTFAHLHAGIRVGGLRRNIRIETYENAYGQYRQELSDSGSFLHQFLPNVILFAFDARHVTRGITAVRSEADVEHLVEERLTEITACWKTARTLFHCNILQQTVLPCLPPVLGQNEHRWPASGAAMVDRINDRLRREAGEFEVDLVALDQRVGADGLHTWHDAGLWNRTKQEILPTAAPMYGDLIARLVAAQRGRTAKALVLDLDNTVWGGVVGDEGLEGLSLGPGSGEGESFQDVQRYAQMLASRGVVLAICSKNDEEVARKAFEQHPEMVLRFDQVACFRANWKDKVSNLKEIASELALGLDSLVFLDDNPFERDIVRTHLPMVAVPEFPHEPSDIPRLLFDAGYFESVNVTSEDQKRTVLYQENLARRTLQASSIDVESYLKNLDMRLEWKYIGDPDLGRAVQLINKTNQYNLMTQRLSREELAAFVQSKNCFAIQFRLFDRFGDNGVIAIVMGRIDGEGSAHVTNWLMSCRVLGRHVEDAILNVVSQVAIERGATHIIGYYKPTSKNSMVRDHYKKLGFQRSSSGGGDEVIKDHLDLAEFSPRPAPMYICEAAA